MSLILALAPLAAADFRALVEGAGCRTRQLTIQRIWKQLPGVTEVTILPRDEAPAPNQRFFILHGPDDPPGLDTLNQALGRRTKHYRAIRVEPAPAPSDRG